MKLQSKRGFEELLMARYTKEQLQCSALYADTNANIYGPTRREILCEIPEAGIVFENVGNRNADVWRIGRRDQEGFTREFSTAHYSDIDEALASLNKGIVTFAIPQNA
jgi:hypothetical protein